MREWVRNIYFLSTNQFLYSRMSKTSNNMASQGENNEIVTHLHIMNQWMDQITDEFRDRLDSLERH